MHFHKDSEKSRCILILILLFAAPMMGPGKVYLPVKLVGRSTTVLRKWCILPILGSTCEGSSSWPPLGPTSRLMLAACLTKKMQYLVRFLHNEGLSSWLPLKPTSECRLLYKIIFRASQKHSYF